MNNSNGWIRARIAIAIFLMAAALAGIGCDDGAGNPTPDGGLSDAAPVDTGGVDCAPGRADCPCAETAPACAAGLFCAGGTCRVPICDQGDEGCGCFADGSCRTDASGRAMVCVEGICQIADCPVGSVGCGCGAFERCDSGLICQAGSCVDPGCTPGQPDCICDDGACASGLVCQEGRCLDPGCRLGDDGCFCLEGACNDGLTCRNGRCGAQCPAGIQGCSCDAGSCNDGSFCVNGVCTGCEAGTIGCVCGANGMCGELAACEDGICVEAPCPEGTEGCQCGADGACGENLACDATNRCAACPAGAPGCACDAGTCADPTRFTCQQDTCAPLPCALGSEGCGCGFEDAAAIDAGNADRCSANDRGEALDCVDGICAAPSCVPGETGCACIWSTGCLSPDDVCIDGFCQPRGCVPTQINCGCGENDQCAAGLSCRAGDICVDGVGFPEGPCLQDGSCHEGAACDASATCRACRPGSLDCTCGDGCGGGLECDAGLCVVPSDPIEARIPPAAPRCYTHCETGLTAPDGSFRRCPADKVMSGCVGSKSCTRGSCTEGEAEPPACDTDHQCQPWQICIQGGCYSNCQNDRDCSAGYACNLKVCRRPCTEANAREVCGDDQYCKAESVGGPGYCFTLQPSSAEIEDVELPNVLSISRAALNFDNTDTSEQLVLTNNSDTVQRVTVRKLSHRLFTTAGLGEAASDPDDGVACAPADCPLFWLELYELGDRGEVVQGLDVTIPAGESKRIVVGAAGDIEATRWQGALEVVGANVNPLRVTLQYNVSPQGMWRGEITYFGLFGDEGLDDWRALPNPPAGTANGPDWALTKDDTDEILRVGNALVQRWSAFRSRRIGWEEFQAAMVSVRTESWKWESMRNACRGGRVCYPFSSNAAGFKEFTSNQVDTPVPSGGIEMPFAMTLYQPDPDNNPEIMSGRIDSTVALQYAGFPSIELRFSSPSDGCHRDSGGVCLAFVESMNASMAIGGRYEADENDANCQRVPDGSYEQVKTPWLLPGFHRNTHIDSATGLRMRTECRDTRLPFQMGVNPEDEAAANRALTGANPVPDGRARRRTLELIDGALINQSTLFIIFREHFESFLDPDGDRAGFEAYGMMVLSREPADLSDASEDGDDIPDVYQGSVVEDDRREPEQLLNVQCSADVVQDAIGDDRLDDQQANRLALAILDGVLPGIAPVVLDAGSAEQPHYLCVANGLFDGGPDNVTVHGLDHLNDDSCNRVNGVCEDGGNASAFADAANADDVRVRCALGTDLSDCGPRFADDADIRSGCPAGSEIIFFTVDANAMSQEQIAALPCQQNGTCAETLRDWRNAGGPLMQYPARWRCADDRRVYCNDDRGNLREGKHFFAQADEASVFTPLGPAIAQAFRYKTQFQSRSGRNIGFAPQICDPNADDVPYCYDPASMERIRERVDCLIDIHRNYALPAATAERLKQYLIENFSYAEEERPTFDDTLYNDGFERLYAEMLIMQGDDALTRSFASRFDVAGENAAAFPGAGLEPGGFDISGQAGHEMYSLYQAAQYYQEALDRFYALSPTLWAALDGPAAQNFVNANTVTTYFDRLTRASTQKTRAWSEISRRYQGFNRPDLARRVVERAYTAGYLESVVMSRLMLEVVEVVNPETRAGIRQIMEDTQARYRIALLEMRTAYESISDNPTFFGISPEFIPLPALDSADFRQSNAFEALLRRAQNKASAAQERENRAIASTREFDTDTERFQSELVDIQTTHENQLADICGLFEGDDGVVYPAIRKYGERSAATADLGDPCGRVGNGQIHDALGQFETYQIDLRKTVTQMEAVIERVEIERRRAAQQCGLQFELADYTYRQQGRINSLQSDIAQIRFGIERADRALGHLNLALSLGAVGIGYGVLAAGVEIGAGIFEQRALAKEREIADLERETGRWETQQQCEVLIVDSNARMADIVLELKQLELEELRAELQINQALSTVAEMQNKARRLMQQQARAEQLAVNVEAARNDPNVRIFRNDAIINADVAFDDAMIAAYKATIIYEYYTAQSYAAKQRLFFIRLVERGEDNLNNYLVDLLNAFNEFEEEFGLPDTRVLLLSLKDDILKVPHMDSNGESINAGQRTQIMRDALADPGFLDRNGFLSLPFSTDLDALSPITRNHKVLYIEAEIIASDFGDHVGRLYLKQQGTGVIHGTNDQTTFYRMPKRTAVLNPFFNGARFFDPNIYKSYRFRDRPLVNTSWELLINQRSEEANEDLNLQSLTDIRLFVYYTDFSAEL